MVRKLVLLVSVCVSLATIAQALDWTTNTSLPAPKRSQCVVCDGGTHIYVVAGRPDADNGTITRAGNEVYLGMVGPAGSITWTSLTDLPTYRADGGAAIYNDRLYYYGGWDENYTTCNTCYYAPINPDGTIGSWVTSAVTIPDESSEPYADAFGRPNFDINGRLYVINGESNSGTRRDVVLYSTIQGSGDYGAWTSTNEPSGGALWFHALATTTTATNTYLYLMGGAPQGQSFTGCLETVQRATVNGDGSLSTWDEITSMPERRVEIGATLDQDKIYVGCGWDATLGGLSDTVLIGTINPADASVSWETDATAFPISISRTSMCTFSDPSGNIYIGMFGGGITDGNTSTDQVFTAKVRASSASTAARDWNYLQ
jgi:hypothetical protein